MNERDILRIERELEISLPVSYRSLVIPFKVPAYNGNNSTEIWDDAAQIIELNQELRSGACGKAWPTYLFALGRDGSGCMSAIDLRDALSPVWWIDRALDGTGSGQGSQSLEEWSESYLADIRSDLLSDGIDPDSSPADLEKANSDTAKEEVKIMLGCIGIAVLLTVISVLVTFWYFK